MMNEADREYGPTPKDAQYEHTDIEAGIAGRFAIWLTIAMVISAAIVSGVFWLFEGREQVLNEQNQRFPLTAGRAQEPQSPRLQTQPFKDIYLLRQAERERLESYGWVDQAAGVVRIPVNEALRILSERGELGVAETPNGLDEVVADSSSGRTRVRR